MEYTIGIDVGGTKTAYGLFDSRGKLLTKRRLPSNAALSAEAFFDELAANARDLLDKRGIDFSALRGIGIGMPSYIRYEEGYIVKTVNLGNIRNFAARDYLKSILGEIPIKLDNDSHTGAIAEYCHGAGRGFDNMVYCAVSTGISSGIIIGGKLFRGSYGWAGESGHMIVTPDDGVECGCGNTGCIMSWCSGAMIVKHIQQWIAAGETSLMTELAGSPDKITAIHLDEAWTRGDALAKRAGEQMAQYLAIWLYNLYVTLNINCFIFGGGLLKMGDKLFARMRQIFDSYNQDYHVVDFRRAELGEDFGIIGARELLFEVPVTLTKSV
jgi:glucokinase